VALAERSGLTARHAVCYYSAANSGRAYEVPSERDTGRYATVFGDCLLDALERAVLFPLTDPDRWVVADSSLEYHLRRAVIERAARHDQDQTIGHAGDGVGETVFTEVDRPDVLFDLDVIPPDAARSAVANLYDGASGLRPLDSAPVPVRDAAVPAGHWMLDIVQPSDGAYEGTQAALVVWPPSRYVPPPPRYVPPPPRCHRKAKAG
jgi:hypothetical protein